MAAVVAVHGGVRAWVLPVWLRDLLISIAIVAFIFATYALSGFPTLASPGGDNDSMLRLVEVRDLLNGQGWFDLHQYRMGPVGGFVIHWSRLIDAPLAALILLASVFGATQPLAEAFALIAWPFLLMVATLYGLVALTRSVADEMAVFPGTALAAGALFFDGIYRPGSIDHHNAQIALTVAMLVLLIRAPQRPLLAGLAGLCAATMLAIGMETVPYVAVAGAAVSLLYLAKGEPEARCAAAFGAGLAVSSLGLFLLTVGPRNWFVPACDALSDVQLCLAAVGGLGLAGVASTPSLGRSFGTRLLALSGLAVVFVGFAHAAFPQCLADPYANVDPRLRELWLDSVAEAQSVFSLAKLHWTDLLTYYVTPLAGLCVLGAFVAKRGASRGLLLYAGFLFAAVMVSFWQVRGALFAVPMATTALAIGVGILRTRAEARKSTVRTVAALAAWILSFNLIWSVLGSGLDAKKPESATSAATTDNVAADNASIDPETVDCSARKYYRQLAALPAGTVLAVSDLGSPILVNTAHRVLSGPYHRNIAGNLAVLDAMLSPAADARAVALAQGVDYVALCRGNAEVDIFSDHSPAGLMADLKANRAPAWLSPLPREKDQPIELYSVIQPN